MGKMGRILLYLLWVIGLVLLLTTTFTNFQYEDLNLLTGVAIFFAFLNSFFLMTKDEKPMKGTGNKK